MNLIWQGLDLLSVYAFLASFEVFSQANAGAWRMMGVSDKALLHKV